MAVTIASEVPRADEIVRLYQSVGWTAYTDDPRRLVDAVNASYQVLTARSEAGALVGLARTISDGLTVAYVQDILVSPECQRQGVGGALLDEVLAQTQHIRQLVLLTDAEEGQRKFYESRGLIEVHDFAPQLRSFVRLR
ncbi:GNAT family N-acetyltransferase [Microbacterium sp. B35-04]|uniref:GNAT family N-acetyltransferase n=1 Tax=Microbacterium sp. B35-04 TaxID=1961716 RepID=UPI0013D34524|nr:GNAT family N-acetyltransferase [Microbacterium sp. B35-04]KAF2414661.1 GNAT family N-acetyltransferase [Microbacterium sp. B35-04]